MLRVIVGSMLQGEVILIARRAGVKATKKRGRKKGGGGN